MVTDVYILHCSSAKKYQQIICKISIKNSVPF